MHPLQWQILMFIWIEEDLKAFLKCVDIHNNCCFVADRRWEDGIRFCTPDLVQVGPLNMICPRLLASVKSRVRSISTCNVPLQWWTEFSSWQDFRALLHTGTKLAIHEVVENLSKNIVGMENIIAFNENIDKNGNL